ncbi:hypothetical protein PPERSA_06972 [Pseudocohnilembus persalinus]|uniref:Membrane-associated, eicosanoid/glutathione metabolism (MAPEG) protein n=1 Tax=Pseudocohnilembus persalinus TaxID=266149 RepID=A0A0V0QZ64_PSEPJ|nr:hypothetical protein PPERSA_06972 [Pseudocohnilembus persalinus]|eukprot:KRX07357.1 hypothetical protein PPERSA_06972 [Pseudocohnilembus persalinus]
MDIKMNSEQINLSEIEKYQFQIFKPASLLVIVTIFVWLAMNATRFPIISKLKDLQVLNYPTQKEKILQSVSGPSNNFINLFEFPVLFYLACVVIAVCKINSGSFMSLAYGFVFFRAIHSLIQSTYNLIMHRFMVYVISCLILFIMWGNILYHIW